MVEKVNTYGMRKTIMIGQESYYMALPCRVSGTANSVIKETFHYIMLIRGRFAE